MVFGGTLFGLELMVRLTAIEETDNQFWRRGSRMRE